MSEPTTLRHELAIRYELGGRVTNEQLAEDRIEITALLQERFCGARFQFGSEEKRAIRNPRATSWVLWDRGIRATTQETKA